MKSGKDYLIEDYTKRTEKVRANLVEGDIIADKGFGNFYPTFSQDGKKIYYVSNKSSDYFSPSSIYEYDIESKETKELVGGVRSTYSWIPGQNKILYAKITEDNPDWYNVHDIFIYDFDNDDEIRLTENLRANQPNVSHDGKKLFFYFKKMEQLIWVQLTLMERISKILHLLKMVNRFTIQNSQMMIHI